MVSACVLSLDGVTLTEHKAYVPDWLSALFQESDRVVGRDSEGETVVEYRAPRLSMLGRLDLMGCTANLVEREFERWRTGQIRDHEEFLDDSDPRDLEVLQALRGLTWAGWLRRVPGVLRKLYSLDEEYADETDRGMRESGEWSWLWFDGWNSLISLRGILDGSEGMDALVLDVGELVSGGWIDVDEPVCARKATMVTARGDPTGPVIVLAEGRSDIEVLKASLPVFHPDLVDFLTFLDHREFRVDGGASYVVKFLKAFAAARIPANIVAVLDNDAAGRAAYRTVQSLDLPSNMACIHLPDVEIGRDYPTVGDDARCRADINGLACGIELYLGRAALSVDGVLRPVRWKNPVEGVRQGEVEEKKAVRERFLASIRGEDVNLECFPEMVLVWRSILDAATANAETARTQARPSPEW